MTHGPQSRGCRMSEAEIENRRRIFWLASSLNRLLSAQYGRTMVVLQNITSQYPATSDDVDATEDFITLIQTLPNLCDNTTTTSSSVVLILPDRLILLGKKVVRQLPLILLKTDALFCIYRKLKCIGVSLSPAQTEAVLSVIRSALDAATELTLVSQRWWTVISVPFQSICVLLSLNTLESLGLISQAMEALRNVAGILNTQSSDEALATAHQLLRAAEAKKRRELECLQRSLNLNVAVDVSTDSQTRLMDDLASFPSFEWPTDFDLGFSDLPDILPGYLQS
ncbi:hypothetical protein MMC25_005202 [Agyrium rufum]|nr:hypothetical protein [Agyrium rufum]